ncbi:MAG: hypothetical protein ABSB19_06550 [Methylomonas sp.]|jgi:hypothetical protein
MKNINLLAGIALLAISFSQQASADLIVNTGAPQGNGYLPSTLDGGDWLAGEFTLTQAADINSIQGYLNDNGTNESGHTFTVTVYDGGANNTPPNPGNTNVELSGQATFNGDGWNGLTGLNLNLNAGTYWVAFEIGPNNDTFSGSMPVTTANPLQAYAWYDGMSTGGYNLTSPPGNDFGLQINAVPLPSGLWLFASGLLAFSRFGRRQSA